MSNRLYYSLGDLVDRLIITNLKQWHLEEEMADENVSLQEKNKITDQILSLNTFRNKLIAGINAYFEEEHENK